MSHIDRLLGPAAGGRRAADLLPIVYDELRVLAAARLKDEPAGHTLSPTAIVHEAYLRLVGDQHFDGQGHFFAAAAEAMRWILIDHARAKRADKRRDRTTRTPFNPDSLSADPFDPDRWLDLDDALTQFATIDPASAELAKLRIFGGASVEEAGDALGVSRASAYRSWAYASAWLTARLTGGAEKETGDS